MALETRAATLATAMAAAGMVVAIHLGATPSLADVRVSDRGDADLDAAERAATWQSTLIVSAVSLLARDATVFIVGGITIVAMAWWTRHANWLDPTTGTLPPRPDRVSSDAMVAQTTEPADD